MDYPSFVPTFHQEMLSYHLSPSLEYQIDVHYHYKRKSKLKLYTFCWILVGLFGLKKNVSKSLERKHVTIVYGTETGTSKSFAEEASKLFGGCFDVTLLPMNSKEIYKCIEDSWITLFITSTFGNGEAPLMGRSFEKVLRKIKKKSRDGTEMLIPTWLHNLTYGVFGLGSSAYPELAAFGKFLNSSLQVLGCNCFVEFGIGDELSDQRYSFEIWLDTAYNNARKFIGLQTLRGPIDVMSQDDSDTKMFQDRMFFRWLATKSQISVTKHLSEKTGYS